MNDQPRDLPVFIAGLEAAEASLQGGEGFWPDVERLTGGDLARSLDDALAGAAAPRVWLFVHEPGQPQLGVVAALTYARVLGGRDQAAIVLDGDDSTTVLSRWSGREDAEGWIDMVRYGTSVLTSGVALPFAGRTAYLLGVGSYAPTDITAGEVDEFLGRLRRQADDVLIVCPVPVAGLWGKHADITLMCVDRQGRSAARIAELGDEMAAVGAAPDGLVAYGEPMAEPVIEPMAETEDESADAPAEETVLPPVDDLFAEVDAVVDEEPVDEPADEPGNEAESETAGTVAAALDAAEPDEPSDSFQVEAPTRRSTSGVFWLAAAVSVALIAVVSIYYFKFVRTGDDGLGASPPVVAEAPSTVVPAGGQAEETGVVQDQGIPATADSQAVLPVGDDQGTTATEGETEVPVQETDLPPADPTATAGTDPAAGPADTTPEPVADSLVEDPVSSGDPFTEPVGRDGWALWVYSFPESEDADRQVSVLQRRGVTATVRTVEIADKGRWHRIYMGNFASRADARDAMPALLERLRTDWAQPVRFYAATDD
ncbi:MAG: hypothetical protein GY838_08605 [bacterium]|nr:hypothetical protein [bacterium]